MKPFRTAAVLLGLLSACFAPNMFGNNHDKETYVTIAQPLRVQNTVLQPGRYVFKLTEADVNRKVVSIYNADGMRRVGVVIGSAAYRTDSSDKTVFTVSEPQGDRPGALRSWFYQGDTYGVEFATAKR